LGAAVATWLFCWLYPAAPRGATVGGTVAPGEFARMEADDRSRHAPD
jgi:hypothetical protein